MKACLTSGEKRKLSCHDIPVPTVSPGWLLLKTRYTCICGSDLEYLDGSFGLLTSHAKPDTTPANAITPGSIPGHEFIAEVAEVGEGLTGWSIGDRVVPLGDPDPYRIGPVQQGYENYRCMAEYFCSTPQGVQRVPDHVTDEMAVFVEPLSTGNGAVTAAGLRPGQSAVVFGAGKIGLLAAMAAKAAGAAPVISIDLVDSRLQKAREVGVDMALNPNRDDINAQVAQLTGSGPNAVLICVRDGRVLNQAAEMAAPGGIIVLAGFVAPMEVNPMLWTVKRLRIQGILGGSMTDAMYMIAHGLINPEPLISQILPFDDCQQAINSVYSGDNIAVLLH